MRRMVHYGPDGYVRGSSRIYNEGEKVMSSKLAWALTTLGVAISLKIAGLDLSGIIDTINEFGKYLR